MTRRAVYGYVMREGAIFKHPITSQIVFDIFDNYINHISQKRIAKDLTDRKVKTPNEKDVWSPAVIRTILTNKKYIGDQFHPSIITKEMFDKAQQIRESINKNIKKCMTKKKISNCYSGKIICGECGCLYTKKKVFHKDKNGVPTLHWICKSHLADSKKCRSPMIKEQTLDQSFIEIIHKIHSRPDSIMISDTYEDITDFEINKLNVLIKQAGKQHKSASEFEDLLRKRSQEIYKISENHNKELLSKKILNLINMSDISIFNECTFEAIVTKLTINKNHTVTYQFINNASITIPLKGEG